MKDALQSYLKIKKEVDRLQSENDRNLGIRDSILARLQEEHSCESIQKAQKLLDRLKKEEQKEDLEFENSLQVFQEQYKEQL